MIQQKFKTDTNKLASSSNCNYLNAEIIEGKFAEIYKLALYTEAEFIKLPVPFQPIIAQNNHVLPKTTIYRF
jgi:hypothetical protein